MPKLTVRICGGLGNQLFGFAFGQGLAAITNLPVIYDCQSGYINDTYGRQFLLNEFPLLRESCAFKGHTKLTAKLFSALSYISSRFAPVGFQPVVIEKPGGYNATIAHAQYRINTYFLGYWHSEKYFHAQRESIRSLLRLPSPVSKSALERILLVKSTVSCFVHWRSYKEENMKKAGAQLSYYEEAMKRVAGKCPHVIFYLFTDDMILAKIFFGELWSRFHVWSDINDSAEPLEELSVMAECEHAIVGNSTFSWWAAWLATTPSRLRVVITPGGLSPWGSDWAAEGWQVIPAS